MAGPALAGIGTCQAVPRRARRQAMRQCWRPQKRVQKRVREGGKVLCQRKSSAWCRKIRMQIPPDDRYAHREVPQFFVYVRIPVARHAADPLHLREERIDQALQAEGLGTVVGWGDSLGERHANGKRAATFMRVDISVSDLPRALALLHALLPALEAPPGTEIHYHADGHHLCDAIHDQGWLLAQAVPAVRSGSHPTI